MPKRLPWDGIPIWVITLNSEFPFQATSAKTRSIFTVTGMADSSGRLSNMYVVVVINGDELQLPLEKIEPINVGAGTAQAIEDWKYWVRKGYSF